MVLDARSKRSTGSLLLIFLQKISSFHMSTRTITFWTDRRVLSSHGRLQRAFPRPPATQRKNTQVLPLDDFDINVNTGKLSRVTRARRFRYFGGKHSTAQDTGQTSCRFRGRQKRHVFDVSEFSQKVGEEMEKKERKEAGKWLSYRFRVFASVALRTYSFATTHKGT